MRDLDKILIKEIIKEITIATKVVLTRAKLGDSKLIKSVEWKYDSNVFKLWALEYFDFVDTGRRRGAKRIPPDVIIKWMKSEGIQPFQGQTYNQAAFHITNAIYKVGIRGRDYKKKIMDDAQEIIAERLAIDLSIAITDELAETMTFNLP